MSSSTGSTTSSQVDNSKTCAELINEDTLPNLRAYGLHNNDNIILPYVILFVTAMQIQGFLTELIELLDLCYHSSPFLVVLVALPHSFLKRKQSAGGKNMLLQPMLHRREACQSSMTVGKPLDCSYGDETNRRMLQSESSVQAVTSVNCIHNGLDEWGHFADFEETFDIPFDGIVFLQSALDPLLETDADE